MKLTASKILTNKFRNYRINENLTQTDIKENYWYLANISICISKMHQTLKTRNVIQNTLYITYQAFN